mmetsp:Transcript_7184/g.16841  ORF Transcript_7184/g.16841 Transcript_7184/m.16841 type:complete len:83 (-) Transcript_7184:193-441(-)
MPRAASMRRSSRQHAKLAQGAKPTIRDIIKRFPFLPWPAHCCRASIPRTDNRVVLNSCRGLLQASPLELAKAHFRESTDFDP